MRVAVTLALQRHGGAGFERLTKAKKAGSMLDVSAAMAGSPTQTGSSTVPWVQG